MSSSLSQISDICTMGKDCKREYCGRYGLFTQHERELYREWDKIELHNVNVFTLQLELYL